LGGTIYVTSGGTGIVGAYSTSGEAINPSLFTVPSEGDLHGAGGIAVDPVNGRIYVGWGQDHIGVWSTSGQLIDADLFAGLAAPVNFSLGPNGHLYVLNQNALPLDQYVGEYLPSGEAVNTHLISMGTFNKSRDIALDASGNIYVSLNGTIFKYAPTGELLEQVPIGPTISGFALDGNGHIYVSSSHLDTDLQSFVGNVGVYSMDGEAINASLISGFGSPGQMELALDQQGHIFMAYNARVGEWTTSGQVINPELIPDQGFAGANTFTVVPDVATPVPLPAALSTGMLLLSSLGARKLLKHKIGSAR
jgi:hypothetical protein